jgi:hypothetical protein
MLKVPEQKEIWGENLMGAIPMDEMKVDTYLFCNHCQDDTLHEITYLNKQISSIECKQCDRLFTTTVDIPYKIYQELYERIKTKPARITEEYRQDLNKFLLTLPTRAVSKPFRIYKDARKMLDYYKRYRIKK